MLYEIHKEVNVALFNAEVRARQLMVSQYLWNNPLRINPALNVGSNTELLKK